MFGKKQGDIPYDCRQAMSQLTPGGNEISTTWLTRNASSLGVALRVIIGIVWLIDGVMKFVWLAPTDVVDMVQTAGQGQPSWLAPWFNFWVSFISSNAAFVLFGVGALGAYPRVHAGLWADAQTVVPFGRFTQPSNLYHRRRYRRAVRTRLYRHRGCNHLRLRVRGADCAGVDRGLEQANSGSDD